MLTCPGGPRVAEYPGIQRCAHVAPAHRWKQICGIVLRHGPAFILSYWVLGLGGATSTPTRPARAIDSAIRPDVRASSRNFSTIANRAALPFGTITDCSTP